MDPLIQTPELAIAGLPPRLRLLYVATQEPTWDRLTLQLGQVGCHEPQFRWVSTAAETLQLLRDESFDCVILAQLTSGSPLPGTVPSNSRLLEAIRGSGCDDPCVLVVPQTTDTLWACACRLDAELFASTDPWRSSALVAVLRRAIQRSQANRDNHRLSVAQQRRLVRERDETRSLLEQQRQILTHGSDPSAARAVIPDNVLEDYRQLLRTYVIMGTGNLAGDIAGLAEQLARAGASPRQALAVHVESVETLLAGLGNRSSSHIMSRSDLMALELIVHLGDCYRRQRVDG